MNTLPHVTVALCVKNAAASIQEAVKSIIDQDYPHELIELIVVDGFSNDQTTRIISEALQESDVKYTVRYENKGLGEARRIAAKEAKSEYILWVDGDLILANDYLRKSVGYMQRNPKIGIAAGRFNSMSGSNLISTLENLEWITGDYQKRNCSNKSPESVCIAGSICRIEAINQAGGFDSQITGAGEDVDLAYKMAKAGWKMDFGVKATLWHKEKETWKGVWKENFWYGYGAHLLQHRYRGKKPSSSLTTALKNFFVAYRLTKRKEALFLPLFYLFTKIAWSFGFIRAHSNNYGHGCC